MFTRVSKQVLIPLVCISLLSLTAHMAGAQQLPVPNPSFESGIDAPDGWVLSRGEGIWLEEGTAGQRALGVVGTGADRDANFWVSTDIPMKPDTVYRLRFHARHVKGINGSLFTGPAFNNRDLPEMTGEWQRFTTYFSTPAVIPPDQSHLRFGQWDINGIAAFDAVELMETQPVYRRQGALLLGEGERIEGDRYVFVAPFGGESNNHARPLERFDSYFNTPRWVFAEGNSVVYRHTIGDLTQQAAEIEVTIGYYAGGVLGVEAGVDGREWLLVGEIDGHRSETFTVPDALLPAKEIWVRLSGRKQAQPGQPPVAGGSSQVYGYRYSARLDRSPGDVTGATRFVAVAAANADVDVAIQDLGTCLPGANEMRIQVENRSDAAVTLAPHAVAITDSGETAELAATETTIAPGTKTELMVPYQIPGVGEVSLALDMGAQAGWRGETSFLISPLYMHAYGAQLPDSSSEVALWWASSGWKISRERPVPAETGSAVRIQAARNEQEAAQVVLRPATPLRNLRVRVDALRTAAGDELPASAIETMLVDYVEIAQPTDALGEAAAWPDPLPPLAGPIDIAAGVNQPFWVRADIPADAAAGLYTGALHFEADGWTASAPIEIEVFNFTLPDRMTCQTAFGFDGGVVNRYHGLTTAEERQVVFEHYIKTLSDHHISPYELGTQFIYPNLEYSWPNLSPWRGGDRIHGGSDTERTYYRVTDDDTAGTVSAHYDQRFRIPEAGLRLSFDYRTERPNHEFLVVLTHYDAAGEWMHGRNNIIAVQGDGDWDTFQTQIETFPEGATHFELRINPARYVEDGSTTGSVCLDRFQLSDAGSGEVFIEDEFDPWTDDELAELFEPKFEWEAWDAAMTRLLDTWHFNSFVLRTPGLGAGAGWAHYDNIPGSLLGYTVGTPEYQAAFQAWYHAVQEHLREKGWLDEAFIYWFDEPVPAQYDFVMQYNRLMKAAAPDLQRMLTEPVEPELLGGPNLWCPVSFEYDHTAAEARRAAGERIWWYICTGPKAPYATLFIDHPATELRVWLWQTWQRDIEGILIWALNWWTSDAAYPDGLQNPYIDPMSWCHTSGERVPKGAKSPWGNGDGRFLYPPRAAAAGNPSTPVLEPPVESIRLEMLRDGIEDYEYMVILESLMKAQGEQQPAATLQAYRSLLEVPAEITAGMTDFTWSPAPIETHREAVARAIEGLQ